MATKNSINNATQDLTIDPGASGDSFVQFDINATGEFRIGVDDGSGDAFKISQGSALGTNDTFVMTAAGERTMPLQSAFLANLGTTDSNVTGNAAVYTLGSGNALTEIFDQNSDFVTTGTFTAPVTGRYAFYWWSELAGIVASDDTNSTIVTSNRTYISLQYDLTAVMNVSNISSFNFSVVADMDAADTTTFALVANNEASDLIDVTGSATMLTAVAGFLIC